MTREERLKASYDRLLESGKITQEQYDALVAELVNLLVEVRPQLND